MRSSVAGWVDKKPPPLFPCTCMIHVSARTTDDYERMAAAGKIVTPCRSASNSCGRL
jgi:hypothetical protein